jgi:hypothetical protein
MSLLFDVDSIPVQRNECYEARRYGRFLYTKELLETAPEAIQKVFSKVVPVEVKFDFARNLFEVTGLCHQFDPVEPMYMIPFYAVKIRRQKRNKGGTGTAYYIDFIKIEGLE